MICKVKSNLKLGVLVSVIALMFFSFTKETRKQINISESSIKWVGHKKFGSGHEGVMSFKSGVLIFQNNKLKGGKIEVDMTSLNAIDLEGDWLEKLNTHLKSDDFFGVEKFPISMLKFKTVKLLSDTTYQVIGDLTIKDHTKEINFELKKTLKGYTSNFKVNRTEFNVRYGSTSFFDNLGDKVIEDEFDLSVNLVILD